MSDNQSDSGFTWKELHEDGLAPRGTPTTHPSRLTWAELREDELRPNNQSAYEAPAPGSSNYTADQKNTRFTEQVYCKVLFEATHNWPGCPFEEVAYLRHPHRHVFHIKAVKSVTHSDRDVEFIMLKHKIEKYLRITYPGGNLGAMSCEMLAYQLIDMFDLDSADVSEDNENGAIVTVKRT